MKVFYYGMYENRHLGNSRTDILFVPKMKVLFFKHFLSGPGADEENEDEIHEKSTTFYDGDGLSYGFERSLSRLKEIESKRSDPWVGIIKLGPTVFDYRNNKLQELIDLALKGEKSRFKTGIELIFRQFTAYESLKYPSSLFNSLSSPLP